MVIPNRERALSRGLAFTLALVDGCESHQPNWLFRGEWIDVDGWGREADEACAGSFAYLDTYSGLVATEFGVDESLGVFRWSSWDHFKDDWPCPVGGWACAYWREIYSPLLPQEHEVVHLANYAAGRCPSVLSEGLAVYYDTSLNGSASGDLELLSARLQRPGVMRLPADEYLIAGRFAAFLVHEFGLDAVLDVCKQSGRYPSAARLSSAMQDVFGASASELVEQLGAEPDACNELSHYRARLYTCAERPLASHAGVVEPNVPFAATYSLGCDQPASIGQVDGKFRIIQQIEFAEPGTYSFHINYSDGSILWAPPVTMVLSQCGYCGVSEETRAPFYAKKYELEAGRYWLELRADSDFVDSIELEIDRDPD